MRNRTNDTLTGCACLISTVHSADGGMSPNAIVNGTPSCQQPCGTSAETPRTETVTPGAYAQSWFIWRGDGSSTERNAIGLSKR